MSDEIDLTSPDFLPLTVPQQTPSQRSPPGRERFETAQNELAADDEAKETSESRITTGHACDLLRSRLPDHIGQAIRRRDLLPTWFTIALD